MRQSRLVKMKLLINYIKMYWHQFPILQPYLPASFIITSLGYLVSYNLKDDYDIGQQFTKVYQNIGVLKGFWDDQRIDLYFTQNTSSFLQYPSTYYSGDAKPGAWALKESSLNKLDTFLNYSVCRILGIRISQVQEERIKNKTVREKFYNIQPTRSIIAARKLQLIGKVAGTNNTCIPKQILTV